jgi:cell wall-associated NlpC family hydrolase
MKTAIVTTIFLSSLTIFTGCSEDTPKPDEKLAKESSSNLSTCNILGIDNAKPLFVVKEDTTPKYQFIANSASTISTPSTATVVEEQVEGISDISENVEVVSYGSYRPIYQSSTNQTTLSLIDSIEENAKSFLGTKYVWGATGPNKFDCSGFTQWIYRDAGIKIPRVSRDQAKVGEYVSYNNLRRGDMVFFDTKKRKRGIVTHVGIYLGNGNFIHASSAAKKVVVFNFDEKPFYKERFLWGRRVVPDNRYFASNY